MTCAELLERAGYDYRGGRWHCPRHPHVTAVEFMGRINVWDGDRLAGCFRPVMP